MGYSLYLKSLAGFALAAQAAFAGLVVEPLVERHYGTIHYDMDFPYPAAEISDGFSQLMQDAYGRSMLIFPVDVIRAGLRFGFGDLNEVGHSYFATVKANFTQPRESMQDKDWFELRQSNGTQSSTAYLLFSDTKSRSQLDWWEGEFGQNLLGFQFKGRHYQLGWRVGMDYYAADIYGVRGWQGDKIGGIQGENYVEFDTLQNEKVLTYRAFYLTPGGFVSTHWLRGRRTGLDLRLDLSPATFAFDEDYHLLREKKSTSWAIGFDAALEAGVVWNWGRLTALKLGGMVRYTRTWGIMQQEFYGNTPEAEEGNRQLDELGGINNSLGRFNYALRLSVPIHLSGDHRSIPLDKGYSP